ncbi:MAG: hypothetical protein ACK5NG_05530, partial [Chthoniobacterales bacterium]
MKNTPTFLSLLAALALTCLTSIHAQAEAETLQFKDEFDTPALFIEHFKPSSASQWKVKDGKLVAPSGGEAKVNVTLEPAAKVVVDVTMIPGTQEEGGFAGLIMGGVRIALRPHGVMFTYREKGVERSRGNFHKINIDPGKTCRFEITRRPVGKGYIYSYAVDGKAMPDIEFMNPEDDVEIDTLTLHAWRTGVEYDDLAVYALEEGPASSNTLKNSSFEHLQDGIPLYWRPGVSADDMISNYRNHETYWKTVRIDPTVAHSGKQSFRLEVNEDVPVNGFYSFDSGVNKNAPFTFSIWLKADRENMPAKIGMRAKWGAGAGKDITVGTEWERFSFTLPNAEKGQIWASVNFRAPGVIWADSAQLEAGETPTEYQASAGDARIGKKGDSKPVKNYDIPEGNPSTGAGWKDALVLEDFELIPPGGTPKQKTVARLLSDKENLYLQFSCYEKDMKALQSGDEKVLGKIATGDCVEVFLDVTGEKKRFYHLFVNPDGGKLLLDP